MSRWYDKRPNLGKRLDAFKDMNPEIREPIIASVMDLVEQYDLNLLSYEKAFDFTFDSNRRRWYDNDPHLWLMFNVLQIADDKLLQLVEDHLEQEFESKEFFIAHSEGRRA